MVVFDFPRQANLALKRASLNKRGYSTVVADFLCSQLGDATARSRKALVAARQGGMMTELQGLELRAKSRPQSVQAFLLAPKETEEHLWIEHSEDIKWDPRMNTTGNRFLPRSIGSIKLGSRKYVIHSSDGPICTVRWPGEPITGAGATLLQTAASCA